MHANRKERYHYMSKNSNVMSVVADQPAASTLYDTG